MPKVDFKDISIGEYFVQAKHLHRKVSICEAIDYEWNNGYVWYMKPNFRVWRIPEYDDKFGLTEFQKGIIKRNEALGETH